MYQPLIFRNVSILRIAHNLVLVTTTFKRPFGVFPNKRNKLSKRAEENSAERSPSNCLQTQKTLLSLENSARTATLGLQQRKCRLNNQRNLKIKFLTKESASTQHYKISVSGFIQCCISHCSSRDPWKVSVNSHFARGMDLNVQFSLRGTTKKGYDTNISCYAKMGVYMGIKLKGDEDIQVKGKEKKFFLEMGKGNLLQRNRKQRWKYVHSPMSPWELEKKRRIKA